jgi:hypothetical protein
VGVLLLLLAAFGWLAHEKAITPLAHKHDYGSAQSSSISSSQSLESRSIMPSAPTMQAAPATAIVSDTLEHPAQTGPAALLNPVPLFGTASDVPTQQAIPQQTIPQANGARPENKKATYRRPELAKAPQIIATQSQPGLAKTSPVLADTDVTLLTALIAHANKPAVVAPERSRDIVDRQPGDGTDTLLTRCKQLGQIEGMLCRSRICSGRWESDAACRAPGR